ncbi:Hsp70-binding protein 1-like, partial [Crotalus adamanteus]
MVFLKNKDWNKDMAHPVKVCFFTVLVTCLHVADFAPRSPTMAEGGADGNQPPREHPRNLQGLLQMAVMASNNKPDQMEPMSDERRQWLQEAMVEAFRGQMDEVEQMKECLCILEVSSPGAQRGESSEETHSDLELRESALDVLAELCENLDNAAVTETTSYMSAHLVGTCAQNVPKVQKQALALGCMRKLLRLLDHDPSEAVRIKVLFAISWDEISGWDVNLELNWEPLGIIHILVHHCLVRAQEAGLQQFLCLDGFSVLMRAMQSNVQKLKVKSAFLLQNLLINHPEQK